MGREEGSEWGTHVYLWRIHFDIWQNQYNSVKFKSKIKFKKKLKKKKKGKLAAHLIPVESPKLSSPSSCEETLTPIPVPTFIKL